MDEGLVTELESAIADSGALVVRAQKYRRGAGPEGAALLGAALALGDEARRLHRRDALDAAGTARLLAEARALAERLRALLDEVRAGPDYRAAVAAHRAGDRAALARLLPAIFAGLEPAPAPGDFFAALAWLRRGRPRPAEEVVGEVCQHYQVARDELSGPRRTARLAVPRHLAMYPCRQHTDVPLARIGAELGGRDHSTVVHALGAIERRLEKDATLREAVSLLRARLGA